MSHQLGYRVVCNGRCCKATGPFGFSTWEAHWAAEKAGWLSRMNDQGSTLDLCPECRRKPIPEWFPKEAT